MKKLLLLFMLAICVVSNAWAGKYISNVSLDLEKCQLTFHDSKAQEFDKDAEIYYSVRFFISNFFEFPCWAYGRSYLEEIGGDYVLNLAYYSKDLENILASCYARGVRHLNINIIGIHKNSGE